MSRPLRIAMVGQRGVPATYGGIERHVEEIGARLAERGHEVHVYCRESYSAETPDSWRGMRLHYAKVPDSKHGEALVHSARASLDARGRGFDVVHFHALGPGLFAPITRFASRAKVVQTIHGLDDQRDKWSPPARAALRLARWMSARVPDATVVVARNLVDFYRETYRRTVTYIPNGVAPGERPDPGPALARLGVAARRYVLFVGRLVPEKRVHVLIDAFAQVQDDDLHLVVVGGSSHTDDYVAQVSAAAGRDRRVLLPGYLYGADLAEVYANAGAFVLPSALEGMPLTLLEAASYGAPIVASDIPPHREVLGEGRPGARIVPVDDTAALAVALKEVFAAGPAELEAARDVRTEILDRFDWDRVADETEALYRSLVNP